MKTGLHRAPSGAVIPPLRRFRCLATPNPGYPGYRPKGGKKSGLGFGVELDAATGGGCPFEDDVLDLFDVNARAANLVHDEGQHADAIIVADHKLPFGGRAAGEVDAVEDHAGLYESLDDAQSLVGDRFLSLLGRGADVMGAI